MLSVVIEFGVDQMVLKSKTSCNRARKGISVLLSLSMFSPLGATELQARQAYSSVKGSKADSFEIAPFQGGKKAGPIFDWSELVKIDSNTTLRSEIESRAAEGKDDDTFLLGCMYLYGKGVERSPLRALELFKVAAARGHAPSQNNLAYMYDEGISVKKDPRQALHWYKSAADAGNAQALCNLAYMHEHGLGTVSDKELAIELYRKAMAEGNKTARQNILLFEFEKKRLAGLTGSGISAPAQPVIAHKDNSIAVSKPISVSSNPINAQSPDKADGNSISSSLVKKQEPAISPASNEISVNTTSVNKTEFPETKQSVLEPSLTKSPGVSSTIAKESETETGPNSTQIKTPRSGNTEDSLAAGSPTLTAILNRLSKGTSLESKGRISEPVVDIVKETKETKETKESQNSDKEPVESNALAVSNIERSKADESSEQKKTASSDQLPSGASTKGKQSAIAAADISEPVATEKISPKPASKVVVTSDTKLVVAEEKRRSTEIAESGEKKASVKITESKSSIDQTSVSELQKPIVASNSPESNISSKSSNSVTESDKTTESVSKIVEKPVDEKPAVDQIEAKTAAKTADCLSKPIVYSSSSRAKQPESPAPDSPTKKVVSSSVTGTSTPSNNLPITDIKEAKAKLKNEASNSKHSLAEKVTHSTVSNSAIKSDSRTSGSSEEDPSNHAAVSTIADAKETDAPTASSVNRPIRDKWALVIGITDFQDPNIPNLKYSAKDATDFYNYLVKEANFKPDHVRLLLNEKASQRRVLSELGSKFLARVVKPDDLVVLYFSTHGSPSQLDPRGRNYLVAHDSDPGDLFATGIEMQKLLDSIQNRVLADRVLLVLDACHSGFADPDSKGIARTANFNVDELVQGAGKLVICSSKPNERAWESTRYENGVFTRQLLEGLRKKGKDTSLVEAYMSAKDAVDNEVREDRPGVEQTPVLKGKWKGNDLILAINPNQSQSVPASVLADIGPDSRVDLVARVAISKSVKTTEAQANEDEGNTSAPSRGVVYLDNQFFSVNGNPRQLVKEYHDAIRQNPSDSELYFLRAKALIQLSDWHNALMCLNDAIQLRPNRAEYYLARGFVHSRQGKNVLASQDLEQARFYDRRVSNIKLSP